MNVLIIGSGGREHSIGNKLKSEGHKIYCAPGNGGIEAIAENVNLNISDFKSIVNYVKSNGIDLVVVGPEDPLINGITDYLQLNGIATFGPTKKAAMIEGSKAFSKDLMKKYNIPTANYQNFTNYDEALSYVENHSIPVVIKASGNAAGKGAVICNSLDEAKSTLKDMMINKVFGDAGKEVVVEEFMIGEEASIFAICSEENYVILPPAQDHKAIYDGDKGPNTGGMGSYAPAPVVSPELLKNIEEDIIKPTLKGMVSEGAPFSGLLFTGIMITKEGPKVVEFNCRFGDPETQVVLPQMDGDLGNLLLKSAKGELNSNGIINSKEGYSVCVVMASGGYPNSYEKGKLIRGVEKFDSNSVIHAGTKIEAGKFYTNGGRVLGVLGYGKTLLEAKKSAYNKVSSISFENSYTRLDISDKGIKRVEG
ncbi:MAG: phosphoribosylamine--glycine ligase [Candidatus Cloacimonadota bacterium]|nr:MAG: phosphoribosylamine--glycine ligase [Candidatus Cloacimonadota bacterium]PIE78176.1 MAG: phosphoribosylamine--glycine ligase [Candidatus Delongbacteria bacterium]